MTLRRLLALQGWVFHGMGCWTLTRPGRTALKAQDFFDGAWLLYEDQGDTGGSWRWGDPLRTLDDKELLAIAAPVPA